MDQKEILAMAEKIVEIMDATDHMGSSTALGIASRLFDSKIYTEQRTKDMSIPDGTYSGKA